MVNTTEWSQLQGWLKTKVSDDDFNSWFAPLKLAEEPAPEPNQTTVLVPTRFMRDWILQHYNDLIEEGLQLVTERPLSVSYLVKSQVEQRQQMVAQQKTETATSAPQAEIAPEQQPAQTAPKAPNTGIVTAGTALDPRFTFDNYVVGKSNEFAYQAAQRIAESDDAAYNPFFLYGGVGLGKTHLMHAIAWYIKDNFPERKVLYISSEKFLYHFVRALKDRDIMSFKDTFRSVDVLMIDDVQFIAGKDATQEEFFHTFNALIDMRKQVILTADKSPHELSGIEDRLRSRLGWGLATEIHTPSMETRLAILQKKAEQLGLTLENNVAMFLADRIQSNVRELEGALNRLAAHANLVQRPVTIESAQDLLRDLFRVYDRVVTLEDIQKKVAEFYKIKVADMHSSGRSRKIARPRQIAMWLSKTLTTKSFPEIGRSFGGRDHTTVMHAVKTIDKLTKDDPSIREDVDLLQNMLQGR